MFYLPFRFNICFMMALGYGSFSVEFSPAYGTAFDGRNKCLDYNIVYNLSVHKSLPEKPQQQFAVLPVNPECKKSSAKLYDEEQGVIEYNLMDISV